MGYARLVKECADLIDCASEALASSGAVLLARKVLNGDEGGIEDSATG